MGRIECEARLLLVASEYCKYDLLVFVDDEMLHDGVFGVQDLIHVFVINLTRIVVLV